jgi:hypothetical protein
VSASTSIYTHNILLLKSISLFNVVPTKQVCPPHLITPYRTPPTPPLLHTYSMQVNTRLTLSTRSRTTVPQAHSRCTIRSSLGGDQCHRCHRSRRRAALALRLAVGRAAAAAAAAAVAVANVAVALAVAPPTRNRVRPRLVRTRTRTRIRRAGRLLWGSRWRSLTSRAACGSWAPSPRSGSDRRRLTPPPSSVTGVLHRPRPPPRAAASCSFPTFSYQRICRCQSLCTMPVSKQAPSSHLT